MERPRRRRDLALVAGIVLVVVAASLLIEPFLGSQIRATASKHGVQNLPLSFSGNRWVKVPVISSFLLAACLITFIRWPDSYGIRALLLTGVIFELGTFGWYADWRFASPSRAAMQPPPAEKAYEQRLREAGGRWLSIRGSFGGLKEVPPDLSALWRLPSIGKYGPLMPSRFRELVEIESNGLVFGDWWNGADRALDIIGTRLVAVAVLPPSPSTEIFKGIPFPAEEINLIVGRGCGAPATEGRIEFARPKQKATAVGIVSLTGCSTAFPQDEPILELRFHDAAGHTSASVLRAGIDTAEWAAACTDVAPGMQHRPAEIYSRFPVPRGAETCQGQR